VTTRAKSCVQISVIIFNFIFLIYFFRCMIPGSLLCMSVVPASSPTGLAAMAAPASPNRDHRLDPDSSTNLNRRSMDELCYF
jgi:hypothetical protein